MTTAQAMMALVRDHISPTYANRYSDFIHKADLFCRSARMRWLTGDDPKGAIGPAIVTDEWDRRIFEDGPFDFCGCTCTIRSQQDGTFLIVPVPFDPRVLELDLLDPVVKPVPGTD